jgi:hypothetical protein
MDMGLPDRHVLSFAASTANGTPSFRGSLGVCHVVPPWRA